MGFIVGMFGWIVVFSAIIRLSYLCNFDDEKFDLFVFQIPFNELLIIENMLVGGFAFIILSPLLG